MSTTYSQPAIPKSPASIFHDAIHILNPIKASTFAILCLQSRAILPKKKGARSRHKNTLLFPWLPLGRGCGTDYKFYLHRRRASGIRVYGPYNEIVYKLRGAKPSYLCKEQHQIVCALTGFIVSVGSSVAGF